MISFRPSLVLAMVAISGTAAVSTTASLDPRFMIPGSDDFVDYINSRQPYWVAEKTELQGKGVNWNHLFGVLPEAILPENQLPLRALTLKTFDGPESFDARIQWPNCDSIREIRDQSDCGSCWAIASASVMSDRICIASDGKDQRRISAQDILSCSRFDGCEGGVHYDAFRYWFDRGVVTGGSYGSEEGCRPYQNPPCEHKTQGDLPPCDTIRQSINDTCIKKCRVDYGRSYKDDLTFGKNAYRVVSEELIRREIYENGPVVAAFWVYSDFISYKSGVYRHVVDDKINMLHAVRVIGWGVDEVSQQKYWLITNSWNTHWGENGTVRFIRGINEGGIEDDVVAGIPLL